MSYALCPAGRRFLEDRGFVHHAHDTFFVQVPPAPAAAAEHFGHLHPRLCAVLMVAAMREDEVRAGGSEGGTQDSPRCLVVAARGL